MKRFLQHGIVILVLLVSVLMLGSCGGKATPAAPAAAPAEPAAAPAAPAAEPTAAPAAPVAEPAAAEAVAPGACSENPALSAISIQGGSDFEDTAEGFLTGHGTGGAFMSSFKAPSTWSLTHLSSESQYFRDPERAPSVDASDADPEKGIDQAMLLFYAGHGDPEKFWTVDKNDQVDIADVRLGNCSSDGMVRYVWQCSCQVYAHGPDTGPKKCGGTGIMADPCYDNPGGWTTTSEMNVFDRWGPALDPSVRMACGVSTNAHCEGIGAKIWYDLTITNTDVADAFITSIWGRKDVGLCITLGGDDMAITPLVTDLTFNTQANTSGETHYHIEYAQDFTGTLSSGMAEYPGAQLPSVLPVFEFDYVSSKPPGGERIMNVDPNDPKYQELTEEAYVAMAEAELKKEGLWKETGFLKEAHSLDVWHGFAARPEGVFLRLASTPVRAEDRNKKNPQRIGLKTVIVTYRQQLDLPIATEYNNLALTDQAMMKQSLDELAALEIGGVPVLGGGSTVQLNNDGSRRSIESIWYNAGQVTRMVETKPYETTLEEARTMLGPSEKGLQVGRSTWGYRPTWEAKELRPYYEFWFEPKEGETSLDYPPQVIYVSAMKKKE